VEEFTLRFLDPLKYNKDKHDTFLTNPESDRILETAIKHEQKKFFDHPIIVDLLTERWYGGSSYRKSSKLRWLFLSIWCLFDIVLFPVIFLSAFLLGWTAARVGGKMTIFKGAYKKYKHFFRIPYFIFVRDTLSYLALLAMHLAICLHPSQISFSSLEWVMLLFLLGRFFNEVKQITDVARKLSENNEKLTLRDYVRDRWNILDIAIVLIFFTAILPLRIGTWAVSKSATNNRVLVFAGYLYGLNTMLLTFRAFGSVLETSKGVGTIQIALFHIMRDAAVVVFHFAAITLAFSIAIAKVFVAETSMVKGEITDKKPLCNTTGMDCWWKTAKHLGWSLLDLSKELDFFNSVDSFSVTLSRLLYAAYLVMALILLINMLIALLSNTYQRVQDNSRNEWAFQKAIKIQTYRNYHPIPVPFNIISIIAVEVYRFLRKKAHETEESQESQVSLHLDLFLLLCITNVRLPSGY